MQMEKPTAQPKIYTPHEVMQIFKISRPTFTDWCKKGLFQKIEIEGQRRIYVSSESV
jgi:predicted site-specific integrase-resolvase